MDIYVASIAIDDKDPTNRMVFSQMINRFMDELIQQGIEYDMDELTDPQDFQKFDAPEDIPENHVLSYYIKNLKENGNWASWMYDANVFAVAYAGYADSVDVPIM